jgi:hypothetical protein
MTFGPLTLGCEWSMSQLSNGSGAGGNEVARMACLQRESTQGRSLAQASWVLEKSLESPRRGVCCVKTTSLCDSAWLPGRHASEWYFLWAGLGKGTPKGKASCCSS